MLYFFQIEWEAEHEIKSKYYAYQQALNSTILPLMASGDLLRS